MQSYSKDFNKYLKSNNINDEYRSHYYNKTKSFFGDETHTNFNVVDKLLNDRIILLWGEIDDYQCELIKANLLYLESIDEESDINIYINSGGGSVYSGLGLLDVMDFIKPKISTVNTGLAASMAAVILCSGDKGLRKSLKRSRTMIHQPIGGGWMQQASDIEIEAREINSLKKELYDIISERTGQTYDKVHTDGDRDYWMNAIEAKRYGMIDEILIKRK